jgi:uncharacterized membrane protein YphA (DoxX/SURF4 family)
MPLHVLETPFSPRWVIRSALGLGLIVSWTGDVNGHEAWLLTPDEIAELAVAPTPMVFREIWPLFGFVLLIALGVIASIWLADRLRNVEQRAFAPLAGLAASLGPLWVRLGLGVMLGLAAVGGLPRHGTSIWTTPTLLVPDMQLSLAGDGWLWLAYAELLIALCLLAGLLIRAAALGVMVLTGLGFWAFGPPFLAYGPHFLAPALLLLVYGGGVLSADAVWRQGDAPSFFSPHASFAWRLALALLGATFVYLGITYKLAQPTLLIAILDHGDVPTFGLPIETAALLMMLIEVAAGALLALGLLVRPIALFLIGAFTFFAATIGETPLFHANLYGVMAMLLMAGSDAPLARQPNVHLSLTQRSPL